MTTTVITDDTITTTDLNATLTFSDSDLVTLAAINVSGTGEGFILPQAASCASGTAEGQLCWDTDDNLLYIGSASAATLIGTISANVDTFTYDLSTASGSQAITGVGFVPKSLVIFAFVDGAAGRASWGLTDGTTSVNLADNETVTDDQLTGGSALVNIIVSAGNTATAALTSFDTDGFTLAWTKTGTPTGTATLQFLATR